MNINGCLSHWFYIKEVVLCVFYGAVDTYDLHDNESDPDIYVR
ncbi:MAG: hypothetical protein ACTJLM_01730 [Ehrlichia sp.]